MKKHWFLVILLFLPGANVLSTTGAVRFEHLSIRDGLSQSIVECIYQDRQGFMWFGTEEGLNKFDGYKFTVYRNELKEPNSLSHSNIMVIFEDQLGILWIGTFHGGLTRFDPDSEIFTRYTKNHDEPNSLSNDVVRAIVETEPGILWLGTDHGLNRFDTRKNLFTHYFHSEGDSDSLSNNSIYSLCKGLPGELWIGTYGGGLEHFNTGTREANPPVGKFTHYRFERNHSGSLQRPGSNYILCLYGESPGKIWIGTDGGGLDYFETKIGVFTHYKADRSRWDGLSSNVIRAIQQDPSGDVWLGTADGLNRLNQETGSFTVYRNEPLNPLSLAKNELRSLYCDQSGVLWIGTYGGGINKYNTNRKKFYLYQSNPNDPNSLSNNIVWAIYEDEDGILWIGTHGGGLNRFDRKTNQLTVYRDEKGNPKSINNDMVRVIVEDRDGVLWIGTNGGGINLLDREKGGEFRHYLNEEDNVYSLSHNEIRSIYQDKDGVMWVGTYGGGLNRFEKERQRFERYQSDENDPHSLSNNVVRAICQDRFGVLWVGTYGGGLNRFNGESRTFMHYRAKPGDPGRLSNDYLFAIHEDQVGHLWLCTWGGGLCRLDSNRKIFTTFGKQDGLPSENIYGILEDGQGNLWLSTPRGLSCFNPKERLARNYLESDGLQSNEFNGGSFFQGKKGEMFFGGINGFNAFFPWEIKDNPHIPPIVITSFQKMNQPVKLRKSIVSVKELTLSHRDYFFSFEFSALDYTYPAQNRYAYKMEGLDERWIETSSDKRFATYTTLSPGRYVFKVKGSNNDGIWNNEGAEIIITITPPLWKTWWFLLSTGLVVLFSALFVYKKRMKNLLLRTRMETELKTAHNAQMSIMPQREPGIAGVDIAGLCVPANEVGGDFYEYIWQDVERKRFGIAVGDVSGKAMKAAMTAVMANGIIFSKASETESITEVMAHLNQSLYAKTDKSVFTALLIASFEMSAKIMTYINAGLPQPLLKSGKSINGLKSSGTRVPLGVLKVKYFKEDQVQLASGDMVVFYTDGIPDACDAHHRFYGNEHLAQFLAGLDTTDLSARRIVEKVMEDIGRFSSGVDQFDDITVIVIKIL